MQPEMELQVWVGDFGLVSMSVECIKAIFYVKLSKAPVRIVFSKNPYLAFHTDFPIFRHGNVVITEIKDLVSYLKTHNYVVDYGLSGKQITEAYAIKNMIQANLCPILHYICWVDIKNYEELTSLWYAKVMSVPFNFIYPRRKRKLARSYMEALYPREEDEETIRISLHNNAVECLSCLSLRLGHNEFFYGNFLTTLDADVYAHLAPLIKIPFPSDRISKLVEGWPELMEYVKRVDNQIFPQVTFERKYMDKHESATETPKDEDEFATSLFIKVFMCAIAGFAMFGYAVSQNMIDVDKLRRNFLG